MNRCQSAVWSSAAEVAVGVWGVEEGGSLLAAPTNRSVTSMATMPSFEAVGGGGGGGGGSKSCSGLGLIESPRNSECHADRIRLLGMRGFNPNPDWSAHPARPHSRPAL